MLARALHDIEISGLDGHLGRAAGVLLGRADTDDAIDAAVVALANDDDRIATSDPVDIQLLVAASGCHIDVIAV